jgi:predicted aldo/keto reductase-like oxidoreductase
LGGSLRNFLQDMKYRKFGRLDWQVSALGFGLECLPVNEAESLNMLRYAIDSGINFIDIETPLTLKNNHRLSRLLQEALKDGYRQKIKISATLPSTKINTASDFDRELEELLKYLNIDCIDFLTLGGLNRFSWPRLEEINIITRVESAIQDKKIKHIGFFFHDQYQFLRDIIEAYDNWTFCQFQYSYMDIDHHPGASGLTYAADKGLGVVVTKPLLGGRLTKKPSKSVVKIWSEARPERTPAEWGLRWVWNHPEVSTIVSDMSSIDEVKANLALANKAEADSFTVSEELVISKVRDAYRKLKPIPCTACRGCMPCEQGIDVPRIFEIYNDAVMYDDIDKARSIYYLEHHNIDDCNECGVCVNACGLKIPILEWLKKARLLLTENK